MTKVTIKPGHPISNSDDGLSSQRERQAEDQETQQQLKEGKREDIQGARQNEEKGSPLCQGELG